MYLNKQMAVVVVAAMCAGATASVRTADFSLSTPNMAFEIDDDASNARFAFPRNTAKDKDFWRLILDDGARTEISVFSYAQKGLNPHSEQFPALFRYTFPEVIVSNRGVRNAEGDFARMLRNALVYGIRYDAELYVCRRTLDANPAYADADVIGRCCRKMKEYGEFYFDGRFTVRDTSPLPPGVVRGEFLNKDGTKLLTVLHNASGKPATVKGVSYPPGNLSFNITSFPPLRTRPDFGMIDDMANLACSSVLRRVLRPFGLSRRSHGKLVEEIRMRQFINSCSASVEA